MKEVVMAIFALTVAYFTANELGIGCGMAICMLLMATYYGRND